MNTALNLINIRGGKKSAKLFNFSARTGDEPEDLM